MATGAKLWVHIGKPIATRKNRWVHALRNGSAVKLNVTFMIGKARDIGNYVKLCFEILVQNCPKLHYILVREMDVIFVYRMAKTIGNYVKLYFEILVQNCPKLH